MNWMTKRVVQQNIDSGLSNTENAIQQQRNRLLSQYRQQQQASDIVISANNRISHSINSYLARRLEIHEDLAKKIIESLVFDLKDPNTPSVFDTSLSKVEIAYSTPLDPAFFVDLVRRNVQRLGNLLTTYTRYNVEIDTGKYNPIVDTDELKSLSKATQIHNHSLYAEVEGLLRLNLNSIDRAKILNNARIQGNSRIFNDFARDDSGEFIDWMNSRIETLNKSGPYYSLFKCPQDFLISQLLAIHHGLDTDLKPIKGDLQEYLKSLNPAFQIKDDLEFLQILSFPREFSETLANGQRLDLNRLAYYYGGTNHEKQAAADYQYNKIFSR